MLCAGVTNLSRAGGITGVRGKGEGYIDSCYNTGTIKSTQSNTLQTGGIIGGNDGNISNCYNAGFIEGQGQVGGIIGTTRNKTIYSF